MKGDHVKYDCTAPRFVCEGCGDVHLVALPMAVSAFVDLGGSFLERHLRCAERAAAQRIVRLFEGAR